jgi:type IV pilus assembly protein PilM
MAKKITTLYISDTNIRLMVSRGRRIVKLADAQMDMNLTDISVNVREAELVAKIKRLFKSHNISAKKVIVGLSGLHCLSRPTVLPELPRTMIDEAMVREAKRVLPVPPEQLYISWQVTSTGEGKMQAFMVAIPRHIADTALSVLRQIGVKPYLMDIKPLALARLVPEATAIVIDVQPKEFDIVIMSDGVPQPIRTVPLAEEALSLQEKLLIVKEELKRTIQFYNFNNPEKEIDSNVTMYVSGELADEPQAYQALASELGYRVAPLSSPLKCPKQLDPAHYLVNIGLTLKELPKEAGPLLANVNALPIQYQPKPISVTKIVALPATAVAVGLIVLLVMTIQDAAASIDSTQSQLDSANFIIEQRQTQKKDLAEEIATLQKRVADTQAATSVFSSILESMSQQGDIIDGDLGAVVDNVVEGVVLNSISHSGRDVSISGRSPTEAGVTEYARNLVDSRRFSEITVTSIRRVDLKTGAETEILEDYVVPEEDGGGEGEVISDNTTMSGEDNSVMDFNLALKLKELK